MRSEESDVMRHYMEERIKETVTVKKLLESVLAPPPHQIQINSNCYNCYKMYNVTKFAMNLFEILLLEYLNNG